MSAEDQPNNLQKRIRCAKGTKVSKAIKTFADSAVFKTKEARREYIRMMAIVTHEAAFKARQAQKQADRSAKQAPVISAPRTTIEGASVAEPTEA
jgi:hypothetical protein